MADQQYTVNMNGYPVKLVDLGDGTYGFATSLKDAGVSSAKAIPILGKDTDVTTLANALALTDTNTYQLAEISFTKVKEASIFLRSTHNQTVKLRGVPLSLSPVTGFNLAKSNGNIDEFTIPSGATYILQVDKTDLEFLGGNNYGDIRITATATSSPSSGSLTAVLVRRFI